MIKMRNHNNAKVDNSQTRLPKLLETAYGVSRQHADTMVMRMRKQERGRVGQGIELTSDKQGEELNLCVCSCSPTETRLFNIMVMQQNPLHFLAVWGRVWLKESVTTYKDLVELASWIDVIVSPVCNYLFVLG